MVRVENEELAFSYIAKPDIVASTSDNGGTDPTGKLRWDSGDSVTVTSSKKAGVIAKKSNGDVALIWLV